MSGVKFLVLFPRNRKIRNYSWRKEQARQHIFKVNGKVSIYGPLEVNGRVDNGKRLLELKGGSIDNPLSIIGKRP